MTSHEYLTNSPEKRLIDVVSGVSLLTALGAPAVIAAVAIRFADRHPALVPNYHRIGRRWEVFNMYKLATMQSDAHRYEQQWQADDADPRITKLGRLLRKFDLNEVPQAMNILRGEMSMVGARPVNDHVLQRNADADPYLFDEWEDLYPLFKPGLIGQGQFAARDLAATGDVRTISIGQMKADIDYWTHASLTRDLRLIAGVPRELLAPHLERLLTEPL